MRNKTKVWGLFKLAVVVVVVYIQLQVTTPVLALGLVGAKHDQNWRSNVLVIGSTNAKIRWKITGLRKNRSTLSNVFDKPSDYKWTIFWKKLKIFFFLKQKSHFIQVFHLALLGKNWVMSIFVISLEIKVNLFSSGITPFGKWIRCKAKQDVPFMDKDSNIMVGYRLAGLVTLIGFYELHLWPVHSCVLTMVYTTMLRHNGITEEVLHVFFSSSDISHMKL